MLKNQKGAVWVVIVVILAVGGLVVFAYWSVSHSKERSSEILKPITNSKSEETP